MKVYCCWAGKDRKFNNFEFARALGVYATLIILSPIHIYIIRCFYITRKNYEMSVREPNVIILMSLLIWIRLIFDSIHQLTLNLDDDVSNHNQKTTWVFNILNLYCCVLIFGLYFFRVWMFWYKTEKARKASLYIESEGNLSCSSSDQNWAVNPLFKPSRYLRNQRKIVALSILSVVIWTTLFVVVQFAIDCPLCVQRYQLRFIALFPFILVSFILLRGVKNQFGVISEYRVVISLVFINFGLDALLVSFSGLKESYYRTLIDYLFRAVWVCCYLLWLLSSIRKFAVDSLSEPSRVSFSDLFDKFSTKWGWCCKGRILEWHHHAPVMKDFNLPDILRQQELFCLFRNHMEETLCPENLLFFVHVYIHRKNLENDPFLELTDTEDPIIKECARIKMKWVDEEIRVVPTCMEIYNLYIKPFSDLEVNISGKLRRKLVALFESKPYTKNTLNRTQSLQILQVHKRNARTRFSCALVESSSVPVKQSLVPERFAKKIDNRVLSPCFSCHKGFSSGDFQIELSDIKAPTFNNRNRERHRGITIALDDIMECSENSTSVDLVLGTDDLSIAHLYPVWKTLLTLLRNDALIRFKNKHFKGHCNCGTTV